MTLFPRILPAGRLSALAGAEAARLRYSHVVASPDPSLCPLCGKPNRCVLAEARPGDAPAAPCWCRDQIFPQELLESVPEHARRRACICRSCLDKGAGQSGDPVPGADVDPGPGGSRTAAGRRQARRARRQS